MTPVKVVVLPHGALLPLPTYGTIHSAGVDLYAAIDTDLILGPMERLLIPTGISVALPEGYELQIRSRSGLSYRHGVVVLNSPGTIDADYRGEINVLLANMGAQAFTVTRGMRIAQMVLARHDKITWCKVDALTVSGRGAAGFGSTGQ